jgi:hypothetical protein
MTKREIRFAASEKHCERSRRMAYIRQFVTSPIAALPSTGLMPGTTSFDRVWRYTDINFQEYNTMERTPKMRRH